MSKEKLEDNGFEPLSREELILHGINAAIMFSHNIAVDAGWWTDLETGKSTIATRNVGEMLCLIHGEISEAMEGYRKNLKSEHLESFSAFEEELADALHRIFDIAGARGLDLAGAFVAKARYNKQREDHKIENRRKEDGKKF